MDAPTIYRWLADLVLVVHVSLVVFVVGGLLAIIAGNLLHWRRVNSPVFRAVHLAAIGIIVAQTWLGIACPLTTLELWLREHGQLRGYEGTFIGFWLQRLLYYQAPAWVFTTVYSFFGLLVAIVWWRFPPERRALRGSPGRQGSGT